MTTNAQAPELLRQEILAAARREGEAIIRRAQEEASAMLAQAAAEASRVRQERLNQAQAEAARRAELILATVPVEVQALRAAQVEALLESVRDAVRQRLLAREGFSYRQAIITLAAEAIGRMTGRAFVVQVSRADWTELGDSLAVEIQRSVGATSEGITVSVETAGGEDGVIVRDATGHQVWDNRLLARLDRLWPELRRQVAVQLGLVATGSQEGHRV
ncbi:MAG: hypothetical protein KGS61_01560 [Verrucomicrobia bacterium]|nr:hypothetical protein [Verrucomicrobiota bacterium]